jgi:phosphonate transport system substrate-binding protein
MHSRRTFLNALAGTALAAILPAHARDTLTLGLIPAEDQRAIMTEAQPLIDRLEPALGMDVKAFVATDYNGVIEAMRAKKLDVAFFGPFSYVLAAQLAGAEAFAIAPLGKAGASYKSIIIARKDRGIRTVADLKGRTFAFVDPSSTSGHLFPKAGLLKAGFDPDTHFGRVIFSGGHDASAIAVQHGKVDAAAIADGLLDVAIERGAVKKDEVTVVWTSEAIPGAPFAMRRDLPPELKKRIAAAFATLKDVPWGKQVMPRFEPVTDNAYDVVRDTARLLNLDLKKMK